MFKQTTILGLSLLFGAEAAFGDTIQLTPEDTYVEDRYPNTNFGKNGPYEVWDIYVGDENYNTPAASTRSYLKFDLSGIPAGSTIDSARIYLRAWGVGPTPAIVVGAYYLDNDGWDQYTLTWNNQPTTGHASSPTATRTVNSTGWWDWEVKSDVQDALDDDGVCSMVMREATEGTDHNWAGFDSEEDDTYPAYMAVDYTPPVIGPGVAYCFGDPGSGTPCPCNNDNDGSVPGSGCANGVYASGARLSGSGTASLTGDTVVLASTHLEPSNSGLYFQANNDLSPGLTWGDGLRCAGGQLKRLGVRFSNASGSSDTSGFALSISAKAGNILAGDTKYYQCWYRNPLNSPCGADFNATNGYAITWAP